ncbi:transient-receptor-potential-like protein [Saccoglossus kowalevskii]
MTDPSSIFPLSTREWDYVAGRQHAPGLCVKEHELLRAVESGDIVKAKALLESGDVNANCIGKRRNQPIRALQLAAEKNDFHMIKLLLNYGAKPLPKPLPCLKPGNILEDDMRYGLYNAICSPAYLSLVNDDPIMAANEVNHELYKVSISKGIVETSKDKYVKLWRQVRAYSLDILTCCDSTQEARTLLLGRGMEHAVNDYTVRGKVLMSALENHNKQVKIIVF